MFASTLLSLALGVSAMASPSFLEARQASTIVPSRLDNYTSQGCYSDNNGGRALPNKLSSTTTMTLDLCKQRAVNVSATYFGVEYGAECWYGNTLGGSNAAVAQSSCNKPCPGNSTQSCGGTNALQLYKYNPRIVPTWVNVTGPVTNRNYTHAEYSSDGCWAEYSANGYRGAMPYVVDAPDMTLDKCAGLGFRDVATGAFGVMNGTRCMYTFPDGYVSDRIVRSGQANCSTPCPGDDLEWCGGNRFIQLYRRVSIG